MRLHSVFLTAPLGLLACGLALAQSAAPASTMVMPVQVKPPNHAPAAHVTGSTPAPAIIVQGGISPDAPCDDRATATFSDGTSEQVTPIRATGTYSDGVGGRDITNERRTGALAIGPKQDDPSPPPAARKVGYDLKEAKGAREAGSGLATGRGAVAIGPKQDDPIAMQGMRDPNDDPKARCAPSGR
ncbi:MAG: hypothetical protein EPO46_08105 [Lysobacter sp.]|nr:MAG: hypothetical protein EPO46_08105 [Lysobacter sp.]